MSKRDPRKYPIRLPYIKGSLLKDQGLSIVQAFYNNEKVRFDIQWNTWNTYPEELREKVHAVIVDDCATVPIINFMEGRQAPIDVQFYRIKQDLKWNAPGALNLGVLQAPTNWVLTLDSDCVVAVDDLLKLMNEFTPNTSGVYYFENTKRIFKDKTLYTRYHPCAMLMHKETFKAIGGFDEDFVGERSGGYAVWDRDFEDRVTKTPEKFFRCSLMNVDITEYMPDVTGGCVQDGLAVQDLFNINRDILRDKGLGRMPRNTNWCAFEWEKQT